MLDMALMALTISQPTLPEVSHAGEAGHAGYDLSINQPTLPEVSLAGEAGYDLTISQPTIPEVSPAGEAGHARYCALSVQREGLLYMPVAQQCRPATHNLLLHGNCTISQK
jgi:hypothetical protein